MTESCWISINLIKMILRNKGFISIKLDYIEKNRLPSNQPVHKADFSRYDFISFFSWNYFYEIILCINQNTIIFNRNNSNLTQSKKYLLRFILSNLRHVQNLLVIMTCTSLEQMLNHVKYCNIDLWRNSFQDGSY